jgi:hypothetical protein
MTGSAKQSISPHKERMDCFVAGAPRNAEGGPLFLRYRAIAFILMDCAVKPADDEKSEQPWKSAHAT